MKICGHYSLFISKNLEEEWTLNFHFRSRSQAGRVPRPVAERVGTGGLVSLGADDYLL